jgi:hypothetical protein
MSKRDASDLTFMICWTCAHYNYQGKEKGLCVKDKKRPVEKEMRETCSRSWKQREKQHELKELSTNV